MITAGMWSLSSHPPTRAFFGSSRMRCILHWPSHYYHEQQVQDPDSCGYQACREHLFVLREGQAPQPRVGETHSSVLHRRSSSPTHQCHSHRLQTQTSLQQQIQFELRNLSQNHLGYYPKNSLRTNDQTSTLECRRPGHPTAIPQLRIFWVSAELSSMSFNSWSMNVVTTRLYKIGKNALPAGLIGIFCCRQIQRHGAGGNDQLQRGQATAANSSYVTPAFVAATQPVPAGSITWEYKSELDIAKEATANDLPSATCAIFLFYVVWTYDLPGKSNGSSPGLDLEGHLPCRCFDRMAGAKPTTPQPFQTVYFSTFHSSCVTFYLPSVFHRSPFVGASC